MNEDLLTILMIAVPVAMLIAMFLCMRKEKELVGFYKAIGVCGRWYNYFMGLFLMAGVLGVIMAIVSLVSMLMGKTGSWTEVLIFMLDSVICLALGGLMYKHVLKKVPEDLKKGFLKDVLIMFWGTNCRISFFFLAFIGFTMWWQSRPVEYTVNGKTCYSYGNGNELYDEHGTKVGTKSGLNEAVMTDSRYQS